MSGTVSLTVAEYDAIAGPYEDIVETLPLRLIIQHNLQAHLGDVRGMDVLDLACGPGIYTRAFKHMGARRVVGVDISGEQIRLAREREAREKLGIEYLVGDAADLGKVGDFDVVTAAMLLHYSPTKDFLARVCHAVGANLKPGRRFVTANLNPSLTPGTVDAPEYEKYHVFGKFEEGTRDGGKVLITLDWRGQRVQFHNWFYGLNTYESVLADAGFRNTRWRKPVIPASFEQGYGERYWDLFLRHPILLILECEK
jgi:2-polyprenyl-3-methyl-5-hydroxy-6-metoxy-1,4-benzoquinol methylase